jgi:signal transduction histidine kinase
MMELNRRVLVIDDDPGVRESYRDILAPGMREDVLAAGAALFEGAAEPHLAVDRTRYDVTQAERGQQGVEAVERAVRDGQPFAVAFVDMKMPGIDGAETSKRLWALDPKIEIVIVTAYSEHTPAEIVQVAGRDDLFYLRKPFNPEEIRQFARALTNSWNLERERESLTAQLRRTNQQLADMNRNLQKKVEEQTALLIQSEKMATVGILAAGVAHEINNPISFVTGNLAMLNNYAAKIRNLMGKYELLEEAVGEAAGDRQRMLVEEIMAFKAEQKVAFILEDLNDLVAESLEGTDRVKNIVNDLRTFSRVDQAEYKAIDLHESLDATINIIWNEIKYKTVIEKDYGSCPAVRCFPQKISQVFLNLLHNAAQAIEKQGAIRITTRYREEGRRLSDRFVEIQIADTGVGIPKEHLSKIFDPFFTTKPVGQGTGLGLSITYDIIKAHGGSIAVDSREGDGATFTIKLPVEARP